MNTSSEMRICVYSDSDKTVLKRALERSDQKNFVLKDLKSLKQISTMERVL